MEYKANRDEERKERFCLRSWKPSWIKNNFLISERKQYTTTYHALFVFDQIGIFAVIFIFGIFVTVTFLVRLKLTI